jgi:hypothetical protein
MKKSESPNRLVLVRGQNEEALQLIRDFLEPLGLVVISSTDAAEQRSKLLEAVVAGHVAAGAC